MLVDLRSRAVRVGVVGKPTTALQSGSESKFRTFRRIAGTTAVGNQVSTVASGVWGYGCSYLKTLPHDPAPLRHGYGRSGCLKAWNQIQKLDIYHLSNSTVDNYRYYYQTVQYAYLNIRIAAPPNIEKINIVKIVINSALLSFVGLVHIYINTHKCRAKCQEIWITDPKSEGWSH